MAKDNCDNRELSVSTSTREPLLDNVRFLLMTLVIFGHALEQLKGIFPSVKLVYIFIYSFHIPLFVFLSGMYAKTELNRSDYWKMLTRLAIPYILFQILYALYKHMVDHSLDINIVLSMPYRHMWYFVSLFSWRLLLPIVMQIRFGLAFAVALGILIGYSNLFGPFLSLSRTIVFFPFFIAGYLVPMRRLKLLSNYRLRIASVAILGVAMVLCYYYARDIHEGMLFGKIRYAAVGWHDWSAGAFRLAFYGVATILGAATVSLTPVRKLPFITALGARTVYPYILHVFALLVASKLGLYRFLRITIDSPVLIIIALAVLSIAIHVFFSSKPVVLLFSTVVTPSRRVAHALLGLLFLVTVLFMHFPSITRFNALRKLAVDVEKPVTRKTVDSCRRCLDIPPDGVIVEYPAAHRQAKISILLASGNRYRLLYFKNSRQVGTSRVDLLSGKPEALIEKTVKVPARAAKVGFSQLVIEPIEGEWPVLGHVR